MALQLPAIRDQTLRDRALTHRSFTNENPGWDHNERLEFLGDALLGFLVTDLLYEVYPDMSEAQMTRLRSQLVEEPQLATFARQFGLGDRLSLGRGAANDGGRDSDAVLSDAFEAYVAALYLDSGLDVVRVFVDELMEAELDRREQAGEDTVTIELTIDVKGRLQQWALAKVKEIPTYVIVKESGPDHARLFTAEVRIGGRAYGQGTGKRKQEAEKAAAQAAYESIQAEEQDG
ncbi:MAG: ribonuclease III [Oscillatoriales cyanobacterium]|nr:MAG: ribonuclease III [Oscillatoriales cyanobacterium]